MKVPPNWTISPLVSGGYRTAWIIPDILAGLVLAALVVPLGLAYAPLAGLEPVHGVYASLTALIAYAIFGPSRFLVLGPDSSTAPLVAAVVVPLALSDPAMRATLAAMLAVLVGGISLLVGVARLGYITDLLSKPVRIGYMNGLALVIIVSQLPKLFGFQVPGSSVVERLTGFASSLDQTVIPSLALGALSLVIMLLGRRFASRVPTILGVVAAAAVIGAVTDAAQSGVAMVGPLPTGLPSFAWPALGWQSVLALAAGAVGIAAITLADTSVLSDAFARNSGSEPHANREFIAVGVANVVGGVFQGFPVSGSATRSAVSASAGAKTQVAGLVAAAVVGVMLVLAPWLLATLPLSVLAAVVVIAGIELADIGATARLWHQRRTEFVLSVATFVSVILLGVLAGVFFAIVLSMLNVLRRQWRPHDAVLGRVPGVKGYHDTLDITEARQIPGLMLYRFDAPLFFANARVFRNRLYERIAEQPGVRRVVLVAEPLIDVDTTAAETLATIIVDLDSRGIEMGFAGLTHEVRERLERCGIMRLVKPDLLYPTIGEAVHGFVADTGVDWVDWEEDGEVYLPTRRFRASGASDGDEL